MRGAGSSFGWLWIGYALRLRRRQVLRLLLAIGLGYAAGLVFPIAIQRIVDAIVAGRADLGLVGLALLAVAAVIVELALVSVRQTIVIALGAFLDRRISRKVFAHLMRVRADGARFRTGEIINHFKQIAKIRDFILHQVPHSLIDAGGALIALGLVVYYDWVIGLVLIGVAPGIVVLARGQLSGIWKSAEAFYKAVGSRDSTLAETVNGLITVKALAVEGARVRRWEHVTVTALNELRGVMDLQRRFGLRSQAVSRGATLLVIIVGCWRMYGGHLTVGEFLAIQVVAARITGPLLGTAEILRLFQEVNVAVAQVRGLLDMPREAADRRPARRSLGAGGVRLDRVSLTYPGAAHPALREVSTVLPARGTVAIVGRNGSGKSTLLRILLGLQREYTGSVTLGGADLKDYDPRWLRGRIGTVDQDTVLFSGSVRENLTGGGHAPEAVREALRFAGVLDVVEALPQGAETELGEGGRTLSGGQRQRLSIARAVIRDPAVALLDEPTAFLDPEAALALERNLAVWGRDRLLILVTHHLAAARNADRILVLDKGRLVGEGRHDALVRDVPVYAALWHDYTRSLATETRGQTEPA